MAIVRSAVIQDCPVVFHRVETIDKVRALVMQASQQGAQLVVMPEAFVSAYPVGLDFGARVGLRHPKGRDDFRRYFESALEVPGPDCDRIGKISREANAFLVIGVIEHAGGTLYCTVLFFSPEGRLIIGRSPVLSRWRYPSSVSQIRNRRSKRQRCPDENSTSAWSAPSKAALRMRQRPAICT